MLINIITTLLVFIGMNLYKSVWSFAGLHEATLVVGACVISTALQALGMQFFFLKVPRSYFLFYFFFLVMTTMVTRFSYKIYSIVRQKMEHEYGRNINTMVIGAGEAGSMIIQEMKNSPKLKRRVVCIIYDNP